MKQWKPVIAIAALFISLSFLLPTLLVLPFSKDQAGPVLKEKKESEPEEKAKGPATEVAVYRTASKTIEKMDMEEYLVGVVGAEMPAEFEVEALKAQALAARTYVLNHILNPGNTNLPEGADVNDTVNYQVYKDKKELKKMWGKKYESNTAKIKEAIKATEGEVLTYDGKPITAFYFSTSNGFTENAEEYWQNQVPYLKSVASPWDSASPKFEAQVSMPVADFEERLGVNISQGKEIGTITARTSGKKVAKIEIGGKEFTGREIREKLGLRSTDFSWVQKGDAIVVTTKGFGHGIGMSQYGANGMAKEGKGYKEIVSHYYQGIAITSADRFLNQQVATSQ